MVSPTLPSGAPESPPSNPDRPLEGGPPKNGAGAAWYQLTSYIVGLEKQVQYYKSLVEGMQHAAVASQWQEERNAGGSPYVEGLFGHEESQPCTIQLPPQALGAHQDEELVEGKEQCLQVMWDGDLCPPSSQTEKTEPLCWSSPT